MGNKRYGQRDRRGQLPQRRSISERPAVVAQRRRLGDWEADTIVGQGHQQAIVSLTERKSKFTLLRKVEHPTALRKVEHPTAVAVRGAMIDLLTPFAAKVQTITSDNGREFAQHQEIAASLGADFYFAHPYAAWERGLNENTNGLVRQYFPKGSAFTDLTPAHIETVIERLNHRPRKTLDFATPHEVFYELTPVALAS